MPIGLLLRHIVHVHLSQRFDLHCNNISIVTIYAYTRYIIKHQLINSSHTHSHRRSVPFSLPSLSSFVAHFLVIYGSRSQFTFTHPIDTITHTMNEWNDGQKCSVCNCHYHFNLFFFFSSSVSSASFTASLALLRSEIYLWSRRA